MSNFQFPMSQEMPVDIQGQSHRAGFERPFLPIIFLCILIAGASGYLFWRGVVKKQPFFQKGESQVSPSPQLPYSLKSFGIIGKINGEKLTVKDSPTGAVYNLTITKDTKTTTGLSEASASPVLKAGDLITFEASLSAKSEYVAGLITLRAANKYLPGTGAK